MEGASNGGMLYHEVQESKLCAVHCVNTVLQGPFFSEFDLAALASDLDRKERQMMMEGVGNALASADGDFLSQESHNVSLDGDFSIQVLERALEVWDLQVIPSNSPAIETAQFDPANESAFICHLQDHWFCIRKVNGEWYNFDSLYAAPQHLSRFYLSAYLDSLKGFGWSIFIVRGNFPRECPISSAEAPSGYGQWLAPDDAKRISTSSNQTWAPPAPPPRQQQNYKTASEMEDDDLRAAIAASLMDTGSSNLTATTTTTTTTQGGGSSGVGTTVAEEGRSGAAVGSVEAEEGGSAAGSVEVVESRSSGVEVEAAATATATATAEESGSRSIAVEAAAAGTDDDGQDGQKK